ncbi:MAG: hypothetical protein D6831_00365 [Aquificota bacterium]|nr:MAG: hypothetical protein D6831_00365 [Aquificota bacterium]
MMIRYLFFFIFIFIFFSCDFEGEENHYITGTAKLGNLSGALVRLFEIDNDGNKKLVDVDVTTDGNSLGEIGKFKIPENKIKDDSFYLIEVSGGVDWDNDDNGIKDEKGTLNKGKIRAFVFGNQLKRLDGNFKVTLISELIYEYLSKEFKYSFDINKFKESLDEASKFIIDNDINGDLKIDYTDALLFEPSLDIDKLKPSVSDNYFSFIEKIHKDSEYPPILNIEPVWIVGNYENAGFIFDAKFANDNVVFGTQHGDFGIYNLERPDKGIPVSYRNVQNWIWNVEVVDNTAILAMDLEGLGFFDITDPENPVLKNVIRTYEPGVMYVDVEVYRNRLFVAKGTSGISVYDISDIDNPVEEVSFKPCDFVWDMAVKGDYLYAACYDRGMKVVDISDLETPKVVGGIDTEDAWDIEINGKYVYIADLEGGMVVVDVSDPEHPKKASVFKTNGYVFDVELKKDKVYLADLDDGVYIVDIKNPENPELILRFDTPGKAYDVEIKDNLLLVSDGPSGFCVIDTEIFK